MEKFLETMKINPVDANKPEIIALKSIVTGCTMGFKKITYEGLTINESAISTSLAIFCCII